MKDRPGILVLNAGRDAGNGLIEPSGRARRWAARTTLARRRACSSELAESPELAESAGSAPVSMRASWGTACHQAASAMIRKTR